MEGREMKTPKTLDEIRNLLTTKNRKLWFDVGVAMFNNGDTEPEGPIWGRRKVRDEMMQFGWCAACSIAQKAQQPRTENREPQKNQ